MKRKTPLPPPSALLVALTQHSYLAALPIAPLPGDAGEHLLFFNDHISCLALMLTRGALVKLREQEDFQLTML